MAVDLEARRLVELRDGWLNPPAWIERVDEPVAGYAKGPVPRDEDAQEAHVDEPLHIGRSGSLMHTQPLTPRWSRRTAGRWISDDDVFHELLALNGGGP